MNVFARLSVLLLLVASGATAQDSTTVVGTVISAFNGTALPYSTYSISGGARRFTNGDGLLSFRAARGSSYRIIVRQLGFTQLDTTVRIESRGVTALKLALRGIVYRLAAVRTEARNPCSADIRGTELSAILEQVSENAERERILRQSYPFQYRLERTRRSEWSGSVSRWVRDTATFLSTAVDSYRPGKVVRERATADGATREMRIPQLADLADERFLSLHCFSYGGKQRVGGRMVYEIYFEPSREVEIADVRGAVLLDTATFQIRRAEFELTRGDALYPAVAGFRVTTAYRDLAPGLRIFDNVQSVQDFARERPTDVVQKQRELQRLLDVHFLGDSLGAPVERSTVSLSPATRMDSVETRIVVRDVAEPIVTVTADVHAATLDGEVVDSLGKPIDGVEISVTGARQHIVTNAVGAFSIRGLPAGPLTLQVRKIGYRAGVVDLKLIAGESRRVTVTLWSLNNQLTPVIVEEQASHRALRGLGFYERADRSRGTFLTPALLANRAKNHSSDLFRGINGVQLLLTPSGAIPYSHGGYISIGTHGGCKMNLYIDGTRTELMAPGENAGGGNAVTLDDVISANDVGAIEVYPSGVSAPQRYSGVAQGCGTILIWTKLKLDMNADSLK